MVEQVPHTPGPWVPGDPGEYVYVYAAAPDLLAACKEFESYYATQHPTTDAMIAAWDRLKSMVRGAIRKAEGIVKEGG